MEVLERDKLYLILILHVLAHPSLPLQAINGL